MLGYAQSCWGVTEANKSAVPKQDKDICKHLLAPAPPAVSALGVSRGAASMNKFNTMQVTGRLRLSATPHRVREDAQRHSSVSGCH